MINEMSSLIDDIITKKMFNITNVYIMWIMCGVRNHLNSRASTSHRRSTTFEASGIIMSKVKVQGCSLIGTNAIEVITVL